MTEPSRQPGDEIRAGDKVGHRYKVGRVGHVDQVLERGAAFYPLDADQQTGRLAWVIWEGQAEPSAEPFADLIK